MAVYSEKDQKLELLGELAKSDEQELKRPPRCRLLGLQVHDNVGFYTQGKTGVEGMEQVRDSI